MRRAPPPPPLLSFLLQSLLRSSRLGMPTVDADAVDNVRVANGEQKQQYPLMSAQHSLTETHLECYTSPVE